MRIHKINILVEQRLKASTKPFNARGSKINRCIRCRIDTRYCICDYQPDIESDIAALVIMSESEVLKPSNTGRLIADVIKETFAFEWNRTEPDDALLKLLSNQDYYPVLVFPEEYVERQERIISDLNITLESNKKLLLIFIDSSWREARKIFRKSPYLDGLPVLSFEPDSISQYIMRKAEKDNQLSTAEVAHLALKSAGETQAAATLDCWFKLFRESYMLTKTRMRVDLSRPALQRYIDRNISVKN